MNDFPDIPIINPINLIQQFISWFINLAETIFNYIFGNIDFGILWRWLPQDIQQACALLIVVFFAIVIWRLIKGLLPI